MALVTSADIVAYVNPSNSAKGYTTATLTTAAWSQLCSYAETYVVGHLSETARLLLTGAQGLYLTRRANQGQASFTIPAVLRDVSAARVWVNYPGVWRDRDRATDHEVSCSTSTSTVVLDEPLRDGDVAIAEITHTAANPPELLKNWAVTAAVQELLLRNPTFALDATLRATFAARYEALRSDLDKLAKGRVRINEWDSLDLIKANETAFSGSDNQFVPWGIW